MWGLDMRAAWVAFAVGVVALAGGAWMTLEAKAATPTTTAPAPAGRFEIIHSPHLERDTQLLDTYTGRSWVLVEKTGGGMGWEEVTRLQ
jgi:hypothetical protein